MPYWNQQDLEAFIGQQNVLNIYQDGGTGVVNPAYLAEVQALSDAELDGAIATEYPTVPLPIVQQIPTWAATTSYAVGAMVLPTAPAGYAFRCIGRPGTSGALQPNWPTQYGVTVTDGTVLWACVSTVPQLVRLGSLYWGRAFSYQRHPDYAKRYEKAAKAAEDFVNKKVIGAKRFFADMLGGVQPSDVGGASVDNANRLYVDGPGGVSNAGDF